MTLAAAICSFIAAFCMFIAWVVFVAVVKDEDGYDELDPDYACTISLRSQYFSIIVLVVLSNGFAGVLVMLGSFIAIGAGVVFLLARNKN